MSRPPSATSPLCPEAMVNFSHDGADGTGLRKDDLPPTAISPHRSGSSQPASSPHKPPLPAAAALPDVTLPETTPEAERESALAAANEAITDPEAELSHSVSSPGDFRWLGDRHRLHYGVVLPGQLNVIAKRHSRCCPVLSTDWQSLHIAQRSL